MEREAVRRAPPAEVRGWLGEPTGSDPTGPAGAERWSYIRGNGEIAAIYAVQFQGDRVVRVEQFPSE